MALQRCEWAPPTSGAAGSANGVDEDQTSPGDAPRSVTSSLAARRFEPDDRCCCQVMHVQTGITVIAALNLVAIAIMGYGILESYVEAHDDAGVAIAGVLVIVTELVAVGMLLASLRWPLPALTFPYLIAEVIIMVVFMVFIVRAIVLLVSYRFTTTSTKAVTFSYNESSSSPVDSGTPVDRAGLDVPLPLPVTVDPTDLQTLHLKAANYTIIVFGMLVVTVKLWFWIIVYRYFRYLRHKETIIARPPLESEEPSYGISMLPKLPRNRAH